MGYIGTRIATGNSKISARFGDGCILDCLIFDLSQVEMLV